MIIWKGCSNNTLSRTIQENTVVFNNIPKKQKILYEDETCDMMKGSGKITTANTDVQKNHYGILLIMYFLSNLIEILFFGVAGLIFFAGGREVNFMHRMFY